MKQNYDTMLHSCEKVGYAKVSLFYVISFLKS